jgi:hypothetical protein
LLSNATKTQIKDFLLREGTRYIDENIKDADLAEQLQPFHARLMPVAFAGWSQLSEHSFSTRSGGWFQEIARMVAAQFHPVVEKNYRLTGRIRPAAESHIAAIIEDMERSSPRRLPNRSVDTSEVLGVQGEGGVTRQTISDLFVRTTSGDEYYFEIKTPKPNKDTSKAMKQQILLISALRKGVVTHAHAAMAYNPFGESQPYDWNYALQFLELEKDLLVGSRFWSTIGDADTYSELLEIARLAGISLDEYLRNVR